MVEEGDGCYGGQGDGPKGVEHIPQQRVEEPVPVTQQKTSWVLWASWPMMSLCTTLGKSFKLLGLCFLM